MGSRGCRADEGPDSICKRGPQAGAPRIYFVACPNKLFPIEPHTLLPFYQFLPTGLQKKMAPHSPGYLKEYEEINLLTAAQLQKFFAEAQVRSVGFPILGNSIVAYFKKES